MNNIWIKIIGGVSMTQVTFGGKPVTLVENEVNVGDQAPAFTVVDQNLNDVTFDDFTGQVTLISVIPSVDTGVCDAQTRRFNEEAAKLDGVRVITISADLPFAQSRWCAAAGIEHLQVVSDHRDLSFGNTYGVHMKELRLLARSIFVIDRSGKVTYKEIVPEVSSHPNYEKAIEAAKSAK
jgi:thioredoxin-dependent peroxiredoxin